MAKIRIKSGWFQGGSTKTSQQVASVMASVAWRVAQNTLKQMRSAGFDIEVGPQYFSFTREVLVFLTHVIDRMAYLRMEALNRAEFTTALVRRVAEVLQENEDLFLGLPPTGQPSHFETFIDLFNESADAYAEFDYDAQGPDFGFVRYLGHRIESFMPKKDQRWVIDQMMATEIPQAMEMLQRAMQGALSTEPRAPRPSRGMARSMASAD